MTFEYRLSAGIQGALHRLGSPGVTSVSFFGSPGSPPSAKSFPVRCLRQSVERRASLDDEPLQASGYDAMTFLLFLMNYQVIKCLWPLVFYLNKKKEKKRKYVRNMLFSKLLRDHKCLTRNQSISLTCFLKACLKCTDSLALADI